MTNASQLEDGTGLSSPSATGDEAKLVDAGGGSVGLTPSSGTPLGEHPESVGCRDRPTPEENDPLLSFLFNQGMDGFFVMKLNPPVPWPNPADPEGTLEHVFTHMRLTQANKAFYDQYLAQPADLLGRSMAEFFSHDVEAGRTTVAQLLDNGRLHIESEEQRLDGSLLFTEHDCLCLYDDQGRVIGCCGVQRDITDLKQAVQTLQASEQRLRIQEEHLRTALEAAHMGTWEWHLPSGRVIWSENLERLMGLAPGSFDGRIDSVKAMIHPEDQDRVQQSMQRAMAGQADYAIEFRFLRVDGSVRWALGQGTVEYDAQGHPLVMRGVDVDITDRKEAEERLRESERRFRNRPLAD